MYLAYHAQNPDWGELGGGRGGFSHIWEWSGVEWECATQKGMLFASPTLEQSKKKSISWIGAYFTSF